MLRIVSAAAGALAGFAMAVAFRPTLFGETAPLAVVLSEDTLDEPYRNLILQNLLLAMAAGSVAGILLLPTFLRRVQPAVPAPPLRRPQG